MTINTSAIKGGTTDTKRQANYLYYINYADCLSGSNQDPEDDWKIDIPVTYTAGLGNLELWAAETDNCTVDTSRNTGGGQCKKIDLTTSGTGVYRLTAGKIMDALGIKDCTDTSSSTSARTLTLYFLLAGSNETTAGTIDADNYATYAIKVDLSGPKAPSGISVAPGDGLMLLNLPTNTDTDTIGYYVFCDPNPNPPADAVDDQCSSTSSSSTSSSGDAGSTGGTGGTGGMGTGGTGGTASTSSSGTGGADGGMSTSSSSSTTSSSSSSTTTTTTSSGGGAGGAGGSGGTGATSGEGGSNATACPAGTTLGCVDAQHPSINSTFVCDSKIPASATQPVLKGLKNGQSYVIAIAAYDAVDNLGPLSVLQCGSPQPTNTFYNQYCADGGAACAGGCGSCTVGGANDLTWPGLGAAALAAAGLIARRERRRRKTSQQDSAAEAS